MRSWRCIDSLREGEIVTIVRKPGGSIASEQQIETLINKGGDVGTTRLARPTDRNNRKSSKVLLRIPDDLLFRVNQAVEARPLPTTRHAWLLEAVLEKLERE